MERSDTLDQSTEVAIIGMGGRFPGARTLDAFWANLSNGVESIGAFTDEELAAAGVDLSLSAQPNYVRAGGVLEDIESFDAAFFHLTAREAEAMDPQQRLFLECAWGALEQAGYATDRYDGRIGVYAGARASTYMANLEANPGFLETVSTLQARIGNDGNHLATMACYKLNLRGPGVTVQSACSTSLVAVHLACQALLSGECDIALAGGVAITVPQTAGYLHQEGGIASPDGHCRAFDAQAGGSVGGNGVGVVVLKRLADALADGDQIHAVVKGSAINNDGSLKMGYTAPSVDGQAAVIAEALSVAGVEPATVTYIEAHGTATPIGDPIEVAALSRVFRAHTAASGFCALGSVKTNIGHLDAAAGVAGLLKAILALKHRAIPPTLHFDRPNPQLDLEHSPFYVNTELKEWAAATPRRAGVSAFGVGGTNAHVVLEEAPQAEESDSSRTSHLLLLSAQSESALDTASDQLADYLRQSPQITIADAAFTSQVGRQSFEQRRALVCHGVDDAVAALEQRDPKRLWCGRAPTTTPSVAFMFPGMGDHYVGMGAQLYRDELVFRHHVDHCAQLLEPLLGCDLRDVLYPERLATARPPAPPDIATAGRIDFRRLVGRRPAAGERALDATHLAHPAVFVVEYALAQLWMHWGIRPRAMVGYSIGEYVAACLAGVFSLEDALTLVARRARMVEDQLPRGAMLAVPLAEEDARPLLGEALSLAAVNGPSLCVIAGPLPAVEALERHLTAIGLVFRRLETAYAFHSSMMDPLVDPLADLIGTFELHPPRIPYISTVSGTWITAAQATDAGYWARHLCRPVRFAAALQELLEENQQILLEVGPGQTLSSLALQQPRDGMETLPTVLASLRNVYDQQQDSAAILQTLGRLWLAGMEPDWAAYHGAERRRRVPLPTYPFERRRFWIEPATTIARRDALPAAKQPLIEDWFSIPIWRQAVPPIAGHQDEQQCAPTLWLIFADTYGVGAAMAHRLQELGHDVATVVPGEQFVRFDDRQFALGAGRHDDYVALVDDLCGRQKKHPARIVHLWTLTSGSARAEPAESLAAVQESGLYSLAFLAQALDARDVAEPVQLNVVTNGVYDVTGEEDLDPARAIIEAPCRVIPQEHQHIRCRTIDVDVIHRESGEPLAHRLIAECILEPTDVAVAYRGPYRWTQSYEPIQLPAARGAIPFRERGVYLITGGLGRIGLAVAEYVAASAHARLVLTGRTVLPRRDEWAQWLTAHDAGDAVSRKIRAVQRLEERGAEVLVLDADVADRERMQEVIALTYARFGGLNGVFHAAGITDRTTFRPIVAIRQEDVGVQFQAKIHGLVALEGALKTEELDFCVLFSSLASILGGLGFTAYAAANRFMDAFVYHHNRASRTKWTTVNWDGWLIDEPVTPAASVQSSLDDLAMTADEGIEALHRILAASTLQQVVVSTGPLQPRLDQWINHSGARSAPLPDDASGASYHPRPQLPNVYVAPANEVEHVVAGIWQDLLGIDQVGRYDSFFALGGHSLLAMQVLSRLRRAFPVELPLRTVFQAPTIAELAEIIEDTLLETIEGLTDTDLVRFSEGLANSIPK